MAAMVAVAARAVRAARAARVAARAVARAAARAVRAAAAICTYLNLNVSCIVIRCQLRYIEQDYAHIKQLMGA